MERKFNINSLMELLKSKAAVSVVLLILFAMCLTLILSAKFYLFQNMVNADNTSKKDIYATKNITVTDTYKTEQQRKAAGQRIDPVLVLAEESYISSDLQILIAKIDSILNDDIEEATKRTEISKLFTMLTASKKKIVTDFLLNDNYEQIKSIENRAYEDLNNVISKIKSSDKNCDPNTATNIINSHTGKHKNTPEVIGAILEQVILSNIDIDEKATEIAKQNAMDAITPYTKSFQKGDKIIYKGQQVNRFERAILKEAGYNVLDLNFESLCGFFALITFSILIFIYYVNLFEKSYYKSNYLMIISLLTLVLAIFATIKPDDLSVFVIPVPLFAILVAILVNPRISFIATLMLLSLFGLASMMSVNTVFIFILTSLFISATIAKSGYSKRVDLLKIGIEVAVITTILIFCTFILEQGISDLSTNILLQDILAASVVSVISGIIALGVLPFFESIFKIATSFSLAELGDQNQPLLKKLQSDAPGTYAHSIAVANLAESAAEAINANPILARIGALYHDIGKLKRPLFFIENQPFFSIENPHNKINPKLSKMIVTAHTKDGVEIAKDKGLPQFVQDMILQHHGQSLATYFYHEALKQEGPENVQEEQFRYNGQKPATKEAAILMIADAVEAAARTLKDNYTQEDLQALIERIIKDKLNDDQLSDSPLTMKDLKVIAQTFERILRAAHHQRIKYHENIMQELENKANEKNGNQN